MPTHSCTICGKALSRSTKLKEHIRSHTGEKPFRCSMCGVPFARSYDLTKHRARHTESYKYKCESKENGVKWGCGKGFHKMGDLNRHLRRVNAAQCRRPRKSVCCNDTCRYEMMYTSGFECFSDNTSKVFDEVDHPFWPAEIIMANRSNLLKTDPMTWLLFKDWIQRACQNVDHIRIKQHSLPVQIEHDALITSERHAGRKFPFISSPPTGQLSSRHLYDPLQTLPNLVKLINLRVNRDSDLSYMIGTAKLIKIIRDMLYQKSSDSNYAESKATLMEMLQTLLHEIDAATKDMASQVQKETVLAILDNMTEATPPATSGRLVLQG